MPASSETLVALPADVALHARPAAEFVRTAMSFDAERLRRASTTARSTPRASCPCSRSAPAPGTTLRLRADGDDADAARGRARRPRRRPHRVAPTRPGASPRPLAASPVELADPRARRSDARGADAQLVDAQATSSGTISGSDAASPQTSIGSPAA